MHTSNPLLHSLQIEPTGAELVAALENGVSQWPALEGRFLQVGVCVKAALTRV